MKKITCFCEEVFDADIPDEIDCGKLPDTINSIIEGTFMNLRCPRCGKLLKPEFPFRLVDTAKGIDVFFIPELDRIAYHIKKLEYKTGDPVRIVIGYKELVEKMVIYNEKLDDRVLEAIKYYLLQKAVETSPDEPVDQATPADVLYGNVNISIFFIKQKSGSLVFHIEGLKKDEIAVTEVKLEMYQKIVKEIDKKIKKPPFNTFLTPPYVSLTRVYFEK